MEQFDVGEQIPREAIERGQLVYARMEALSEPPQVIMGCTGIIESDPETESVYRIKPVANDERRPATMILTDSEHVQFAGGIVAARVAFYEPAQKMLF